MVIKAHLDPRAAHDGQRAVPRRALRLETSGIVPGSGPDNVIIHNISAAGLLLETELDLAVDERLTLNLPEVGVAEAMIVWRSEKLYGCAFEQALGPAALAAAQLQSLPPAPSLPTNMRAAGAVASDKSFGNRLNRLRREAGLTLADVAAALSVSKPTVWAWEKGKARPLPERLEAIAAALRVAPEALAEEADQSAPLAAVIAECRGRIADACGTAPRAVRITIEL